MNGQPVVCRQTPGKIRYNTAILKNWQKLLTLPRFNSQKKQKKEKQ